MEDELPRHITYSFLGSELKPTISDTQAINELLGELSGKKWRTSRRHLQEAAAASRLLIVRDMRAIIGMGLLVPMVTVTRRCGYIEHVATLQAYRGLGIGKRIVKELIKEAKRLKLSRLDLTSRPARVAANGLYQKLGFKKQDTNAYRLDLE